MVKKRPQSEMQYSRRSFLSSAMLMPALVASFSSSNQKGLSAILSTSTLAPSPQDIRIASPNGRVEFHLLTRNPARLSYSVSLRNQPVIETSQMGIIIDGVDLGQGVEVSKVETYQLKETYPTRGVHSEAINHCNGARVSLKHTNSKTNYTIEVRAFDDGIAFRYVVSGDEKQRVPDEATAFTIPQGSTVWFHDFEGHYEGIHVKKRIAEVKEGEWAAPPLTIKLPNGAGYAAITEAALMNYAGMGFKSDGQRTFKARLGHVLPVSHPFDLRYGKDEARRLSLPAAINGTITTPWRVVMIGHDLNTLVNCDIITNVSPQPDKTLFPAGVNTEWVKPGRCVWKYMDGGESTLDGMKEFSRLAGELGFEYNMVEGFWQKWTESEMRELVAYSKQQKVGVWFWKHSRDLRTTEARQNFFKLLESLGVVGAKIDFFDHEAKEIIDLYQALLREAAERKIMVEFHGANKPTGESRTWPNEMTREAVRGMEYRSMQTRSVHNTTLPFTRLLAGHADYTPMHFGERRRETSWAHQIASAAILTSPLLVLVAHPKNILDNPAVEIIKSIPSVWDETIALPPSEIGELAIFARRSGSMWYLAIMNGLTARSLKIPLTFLANGKYQAMLGQDLPDNDAAIKIETSAVSRKDSITIDLRVGGGFICRFSKMD